ncbi:hypothetical protein PIROE2DRAFT_15746 [Piromyces sp. E2]|nr:hypothetical protein PIROE2DRAFT_15746 [Piromyces sp. E2]|eukprot:OUM58893.1 hypothetical protein PIROE2DRAFT_15746 [Piromyces sp. E2]
MVKNIVNAKKCIVKSSKNTFQNENNNIFSKVENEEINNFDFKLLIGTTNTNIEKEKLLMEDNILNNKNLLDNKTVHCNSGNILCSLGMDETYVEIYDIQYTCIMDNFTQGLKDYRYRSNEKDDDFMDSFNKTTVNIEIYGDIKCQPNSLQEIISSDININQDKSIYLKGKEPDDNNLYWKLELDKSYTFTSNVKLETNKLLYIITSISGKSTKGYEYAPLTEIKVQSYADSDGEEIKDGVYVLNNDMNNYSDSNNEINLSGTHEKWLLSVTIGDNITSTC